MSGREQLLAAVSPRWPIDARGDWSRVEARLGVSLPADYKWMVETYGWGEFCDYLYLRTPFGTNPHNGIAWARREEPGPGGLLAWGTTMDADQLCWLTVGEPSGWPVVVRSSVPERESFELSATAFIREWAQGRVAAQAMSDMEPDLAPWFNAFSPREHRTLRLSRSPLSIAARVRILRGTLAPTLDRGQ